MKVLLLAPQPFFAERGTPIAVRMAAEALARQGHQVDLLTYHEGTDIEMAGVTHRRIRRPWGVGRVPIGFSMPKLVCDAYLFFAAASHLRRERYDVVHAVEEAAFLALILRRFWSFRLVYDADSILSEQIEEKWPRARVFRGLVRRIEAEVLRRSSLVLAVCPAVADAARLSARPDCVHLLPDVAFPPKPLKEPVDDLRALAGARTLALYVGNLEHYQGFDLLLDTLREWCGARTCVIVVIGGNENHIRHYRSKVEAVGLAADVIFLGPRPVEHLQHYLAQADILCSPRLKGRNTPMKIYSYMSSGRAILATDIESHRQVLDEETAILVAPEPARMAAGLRMLAAEPERRRKLGRAAAERATREYGPAAFDQRLRAAYSSIVADDDGATSSSSRSDHAPA